MIPKEIVIDYWRAWNEHNIDNLLRLLAPEFISRSSLSQDNVVGRDMVAMGFKMFNKALPDLKEEVVSIMAEGEKVVCEVIETATFTGTIELPKRVIQPTNRRYKIPVAAFFRVSSEGLIVEQRSYWDTASWAQQIGMDPKLLSPHSDPSEPVSKQHKSSKL